MKRPFKYKIVALAVVISQLGLAGAQLANAAPILEEKPILEEILVTARKKTESLLDAPLSLTVVTGSSMDDQGITNLAQLSTQVPGLILGPASLTTNISIRGVSSGNNTGFEQSAGMFVDGIYQTRSRQFSLSMVDVQQVEVLRGPQSLLFGKNTIAGAIKVETASPVIGDGFNGSIAADSEPEQGTSRGTVVLSGDLADNLAGRIALRYQESDGYVRNNVRHSDEAATEDKMGRVSLVWAPTDNLQLTGKASLIDMKGEGVTNVTPVVDSSLLDTFGQPGNSLGITDIMGTIAAFTVPGYQESSGSKAYDSWLANEGFFPGGSEEDSMELTQLSLKVDWEHKGYILTSLTGHTDFEQERLQDVDFHGGNAAGSFGIEDLELFSQELRIASNYDGRLNFSAGLYYEKQEGQLISAETLIDGSLDGVFAMLPATSLSPALPPGLTLGDLGINSLWNGMVFTSLNPAFAPLIGAELDAIGRRTSNELDAELRAFFFELSFDINEELTLEVGGRYSDETRKVAKSLTLGVGVPGEMTTYINPDGSLTTAAAADAQNAGLLGAAWGALLNTWPHDAGLKRKESHFDPTVRLLWDFNEDTMVYLSYSTGYKSGGFNASADTFNPDGTPGDGTEFEEETATAWELGLKTSFWEQRARMGAAVFHTQIDDLQVTSFRGANFLVGNAAEMSSQGVEADVQFAVNERLELGGNVAYLDAEFENFSDAPCTIFQTAAAPVGTRCRQDLAGRPTTYAPEWSGNIYAHYQYPLGDNFLLTLSGNASYKGDHFTDSDLDPNTLQESYWKFNARIGIEDREGRWEVAAYGRNLTDEATVSFMVDASLSAGIYGAGREEPRVYGLQARYNFF